MSIYDNIAYGPRTHGIKSKAKLDEIVQKSLERAAIWNEVKDRLKKSALGLSGGQQQRLCIARALAVEPEVLLMDEPTSALDPELIKEVLDAIRQLAEMGMTMVVVTHEMNFARDICEQIVFMDQGLVLEITPPREFFSQPRTARAREFLGKILHH